MIRLHTLVVLAPALVALAATTDLDAQRKSKSVLRLNSEQLGAPPKYPALPKKKNTEGARPKIMLTGYWPPTNEMLRRFSTNSTQNPKGWIGSNWENRGYDVYSFFPEYPAGSWPRGRGDFEVDYQDTVADWARITKAIQPRAIITFSRGGSSKNWELEMNAQNHASWIRDSLSPYYPNPSPPDKSLPASTSRRSTLPAREILAALKTAKVDVNGWACFRRNGGNYLSEFKAYHGCWYKNTHSDRSKADWCAAAGHVHVGTHTISILEQAVFVTLREVLKHVDRVTAGQEQHNMGFGHRGTTILSMAGTPFKNGGPQSLLLTGANANASLFLLLSPASKVTPYNTGVYITNPPSIIWATQANQSGTFTLTNIRSGGPGRLYAQFVYPDWSVQGQVGISNALEIDFK